MVLTVLATYSSFRHRDVRPFGTTSGGTRCSSSRVCHERLRPTTPTFLRLIFEVTTQYDSKCSHNSTTFTIDDFAL